MHRSVAEKNNLKYRSSWIQLCGALMVDILERIMHTHKSKQQQHHHEHTHTHTPNEKKTTRNARTQMRPTCLNKIIIIIIISICRKRGFA